MELYLLLTAIPIIKTICVWTIIVEIIALIICVIAKNNATDSAIRKAADKDMEKLGKGLFLAFCIFMLIPSKEQTQKIISIDYPTHNKCSQKVSDESAKYIIQNYNKKQNKRRKHHANKRNKNH